MSVSAFRLKPHGVADHIIQFRAKEVDNHRPVALTVNSKGLANQKSSPNSDFSGVNWRAHADWYRHKFYGFVCSKKDLIAEGDFSINILVSLKFLKVLPIPHVVKYIVYPPMVIKPNILNK